MANNRTALKFWERHHNGAFISVAFWHPRMGHYLGRVDNRSLPHELYFHWDGGMNTHEIPEIGFDTAHARDVNFGPNDEVGVSYVWIRDKVFEHLRNVTDNLLNTE